MVRIYKCKFCGKIKEVKVVSAHESYGSMENYIENYSEKFLTHKCNSDIVGIMELVALEK